MATRIQPMCKDQVICDFDRCDRVIGVLERSITRKTRYFGIPFREYTEDEVVRRRLIILTPPVASVSHCWLAEEVFIDLVSDILEFHKQIMRVPEIFLHYNSSHSPI